MMTSNDRANYLDVEDDEQRQNRIGRLLEQVNNASSPTSMSPDPGSILNIGHQRPPGPVELSTELLSRVKAFLPAISASNQELSQMRPEDINIENIAEEEEEYIEMNLGLGVFEAKHRPTSPCSEADATSSESGSDSESSRPGSEEDSESASSYSSSDVDSDSESQSGSSVDMKPVFSRLIKPLPRRVRG